MSNFDKFIENNCVGYWKPTIVSSIILADKEIQLKHPEHITVKYPSYIICKICNEKLIAKIGLVPKFDDIIKHFKKHYNEFNKK